MKLSQQAFESAREYLISDGRPLEQALFLHLFERGSLDEALHALEMHQTDDGAFRDMGEGDSGTSSPIDSTIAFQHLVDLGISADNAIVKRGIQYFLSTYDSTHQAWPQKTTDPEYLVRDLPEHWGNPSAEIVGYLWHCRELVPSRFLGEVTQVAMERMRKQSLPIPGFSDLCYLRCAKFIQQQQGAEIRQKIRSGFKKNLVLDHDEWNTSYFIKPYWYAMSPEEPLYPDIAGEIEACLDFDIRKQEADGSFFLTFSVREEARKTWKSIWTLEILRVLKTYGRIEGVT